MSDSIVISAPTLKLSFRRNDDKLERLVGRSVTKKEVAMQSYKLKRGDKAIITNRTPQGIEIEEGTAELLKPLNEVDDNAEKWMVRFEGDGTANRVERWVEIRNLRYDSITREWGRYVSSTCDNGQCLPEVTSINRHAGCPVCGGSGVYDVWVQDTPNA